MARDLRKKVAIIGAAETDTVGVIPNVTQLGLHAQAARNALRDAGIDKSQIDGLACAGESVVAVADYLDIQPRYIDGTSVGGSSFMIHVAHAVLALEAGYCNYVLITHGESGTFFAEMRSAPGGDLPINTNGGGLSYTHTGMYGRFALQESVRQLRGEAAAQLPDVKVSIAHGPAGFFAGAGTVIMTNQA